MILLVPLHVKAMPTTRLNIIECQILYFGQWPKGGIPPAFLGKRGYRPNIFTYTPHTRYETTCCTVALPLSIYIMLSLGWVGLWAGLSTGWMKLILSLIHI